MRRDKQPPKTKKYFRKTESGAGMTKAGVARYRRENPGSKIKNSRDWKVGNQDQKLQTVESHIVQEVQDK